MFQYWVIYIQESVFFSQKWPKMAKICKTGIFLKNGVWGSLYPLMSSNFITENWVISFCWNGLKWSVLCWLTLCKIWKKSNEPILNNIQKSWFFPTALPTFAPFCPFSGQKGIFIEKWQYHLKRLIAFYLYAKKYKKR